MNTLLAQQLQKLAQANPLSKTILGSRQKASFLFDSQKASDMDLESIHSIGVNGIMELKLLDPRFSEFESKLFSERMKAFDRSFKTADENRELDLAISKFLCLLSPYFLLKPTAKVLEWMIRRFRIHQFNVDSIMAMVLPYHETNPFVKMISLIDLKENERWNFVLVGVESGPLLRATLVQKAIRQSWLLTFINKMIADTIECGVNNHKTLFSFYTAFMIQYCQAVGKIDENILLELLPQLLAHCKNAEITELQISSYMIIGQLCNRTAFSKETCQVLANMIINHANNRQYAILCLLKLVQSQDAITTLPVETLNALLAWPGLVESILLPLVNEYDCGKLHQFLLDSLFKQQNIDVIEQLLRAENFLSHESIRFLVDMIINKVVSTNDNADGHEKFFEKCQPLLRLLQLRFADVLQETLESQLKSLRLSHVDKNENEKIEEKLSNFMCSAFKGTGNDYFKEAQTSLFLALQHPESNIRKLAVSRLLKINVNPQNAESMSDMFLNRLEDEDESIVLSVLKSDDLIGKIVKKDQLAERLLFLLRDKKTSVETKTVIFDLIGRLSDHTLDQQCLPVALSLLLATKKSLPAAKKALEFCLHATKNQVFVGKEISLNSSQSATEFNKSLIQHITNGGLTPEAVQLFANTALTSSLISARIFSILVLNKAFAEGGDNQFEIGEKILLFARYVMMTHAEETNLEIPMDCKDGMPSDLLFEMISRAKKSSAFAAIVYAVSCFSLVNLVSNLPEKASKSTWLLPKSMNDSGTSAYAGFLVNLYMTCAANPGLQVAKYVIEQLVQKYLGKGGFEFFANFWIDESVPLAIRVHAIQKTSDMLAEAVDYQLFVPLLLIACHSDNDQIRNVAIERLQSIVAANEKIGSKSGKNRKIFRIGEMFGEAGVGLEFMNDKDFGKLMQLILDNRQEISSDNDIIGVVLTKILSHRSNEGALKFMLSYILVCDNVLIRTKILELISGVKSDLKLKTLHPLIEQQIVKSLENRLPLGNGLDSVAFEKLLVRLYDLNSVELIEGKSKRYRQSLFKLFKLLTDSSSIEPNRTLAKTLVLQISPHFFAALEEENQHKIFASLVSMTIGSATDFRKICIDVICKLKLSQTLLRREYSECISQISGSNEVGVIQSEKRANISLEHSAKSALVPLTRMLALLEISLQNLENIAEFELLGPLFFEFLAVLLGINEKEIISIFPMEYSKQLVLSCLLKLYKNAEERKIKMNGNGLRVDLLVQTIRSTDNPQTHNHALLLMATISKTYPDPVLHNIMPVFTFMGTSVLRHDDHYSFHVVKQTMETIIPPLVENSRSHARTKEDLVLSVRTIIQTFVGALYHIPKHRRLRLFSILLQTMDPQEFLDCFIALILAKYEVKPEQPIASSKAEDESASEFAMALCTQFESHVQISALIAMAHNILEWPQQFAEMEKNPKSARPTIFEFKSQRQLLALSQACMQFTANLLKNSYFLDKLPQKGSDAEMELETGFLSLVEKLMNLVNNFNVKIDKAAQTKDKTAIKSYRACLDTVYKAIENVNNLLSEETFVNISVQLIAHQDQAIRKKTILLFNNRLQSCSVQIKNAKSKVFLRIMDTLRKIISAESDEETPVNKQNALLSFGLLCTDFAEVDPQSFMDFLPVVLGEGAMLHPNLDVQISAFAAMAVAVENLGPRIIPYIGKLVPHLVTSIQKSFTIENDLLRLGAFTALKSVIVTVPQFISPHLPGILECCLHKSVHGEGENERKSSSEIQEYVLTLCSHVAENVQPRLLLAPLFAQYGKCVDDGGVALITFYDLVSELIGCMSRDTVITHYKQLFKFYLTAFDLRFNVSATGKIQDGLVDKIELACINSFISLVMKLNESYFKPLFLKLVDWVDLTKTTEASGNASQLKQKSRILILYRLINALLDRLKSIFAPYYGYILDFTTKLLTDFSDNTKASLDQSWELVIDSLQKTFLYDINGLMSKEKMELLLRPLVDQIPAAYIKQSREEYLSECIRQHLLPCLGQMALCGKQEENILKQLNHQILLQTRDERASVRLASLEIIQELYSRMGEDFLVYLPETVPFLAELMEDDDEQVEKKCRQIISIVEEYLGESLQSHLT